MTKPSVHKARKLYVKQVVDPNWQPSATSPKAYNESLNDPNRFLFHVKKVLNSSTPNIWAELTHDELDVYCNSENWEVTIT